MELLQRQNPASLHEKWGFGIDFMATFWFGLIGYSEEGQFNAVPRAGYGTLLSSGQPAVT
jgi:hypothetical protein